MKVASELKAAWETLQDARPPVEKELSRVAFQMLAEGVSVPINLLVHVLGWDEKRVTNELRRMADEGRCTLDTAGVLTGIMGLSVVPAPHQLRLDEKTFFTWCALDAVAIHATLGKGEVVKSRTADGGSDIALRFQNGHWLPEDVWIGLIEPEKAALLCGGT